MKEIRLALQRVVFEANPPVQAHNIAYTLVHDEVIAEVGHLDLFAMQAQMDEARKLGKLEELGSMDVAFFVSARFVLSLTSAKRFVEAGKQLAKIIESAEKGDGNVDRA